MKSDKSNKSGKMSGYPSTGFRTPLESHFLENDQHKGIVDF